jgi:hypothetical protein
MSNPCWCVHPVAGPTAVPAALLARDFRPGQLDRRVVGEETAAGVTVALVALEPSQAETTDI